MKYLRYRASIFFRELSIVWLLAPGFLYHEFMSTEFVNNEPERKTV